MFLNFSFICLSTSSLLVYMCTIKSWATHLKSEEAGLQCLCLTFEKNSEQSSYYCEIPFPKCSSYFIDSFLPLRRIVLSASQILKTRRQLNFVHFFILLYLLPDSETTSSKTCNCYMLNVRLAVSSAYLKVFTTFASNFYLSCLAGWNFVKYCSWVQIEQ